MDVFRQNYHKIVILSGARTDLSRDTALDGAESKDPGGAYLAHAVRAFSTSEAREQDLPAVRTGWSRVHLFMHCNHLPSPGLCKIFELGVDRANKVELLFAPPAFELLFPSDGCANVLTPSK